MQNGLFALVFSWLLTTPLLAQFELRDEGSARQFIHDIAAETERLIEKREDLMDRLEAATQEHGRRLSEVQSLPPGERYEALIDAYIWRLTTMEIYLPLSFQTFRWDRAWQAYFDWVEIIQMELIPHLEDGSFRWFSHHSFAEDRELFREVERMVEFERLEFIQSQLNEIREAGTFDKLRQLAAEYDSTIREGLDAQAAGDNDRVRQLHNKAAQLHTDLNNTREALEVDLKSRGKAFRDELDEKIEVLKNLEFPEKGRIHRAETRPRKINTTRNKFFVIRFSGENIPYHLDDEDVVTPAGLKATRISGGGERMQIAFEVTGDIPPGESEILIAGLSYKIDFDPQHEPDPDEDPLSPNRTSPFLGPQVEGELPEDGQGTLLYWRALSKMKQSLKGYWRYDKKSRESDPDNADTVFSFEYVPETGSLQLLYAPIKPKEVLELVPFEKVQLTETPFGVTGQYPEKKDPFTYEGLSLVQEKVLEDEEPHCPQYRWWEPAIVQFDSDYLSAVEKVDGRTQDEETCDKTETPSPLEFRYERFVGVTFSPFKGSGGYIHTSVVSAPAAYQVSVRLTWDYSLLPGSVVKASYKKKNGSEQVIGQFDSKEAGEHIFVSHETGQFLFQFEVIDAAGNVIHVDRALALLDR